MPSLTLDYPRDDAITLVKLAFEKTDGIQTYHDNGLRIVGKTGADLLSYGEKVIVEVPESQSHHETMVHVHSEKEIPINITANPDKYEARFRGALNALRGHSIDTLLERSTISAGTTKEVGAPSAQADGRWLLYVALAFGFFITIILPFMMFP